MLTEQVQNDLELDTVSSYIPLQTAWGKQEFYQGLQNPVSDHSEIKRRQLPLFALRTSSIRSELSKILTSIQCDIVDDSISIHDSRIQDSVSQVLWKPDSFGSFLNSSPTILNFIITWKTLILPGFAILMPLIAVIVPFFVLQYTNHTVNTTEYLERIKVVLLQQITIPSFLKSRGHDDKLGFIFESLFIGLTLAMFISSLWNQVTSSMNLRNVWNDLAFRGDELQNLIKSSKQILTILMTLPEKKRKGCKRILDEGTSVLEACTHLEGLNHVSTFGTVWNSSKCIERLKSWIGKIDVCVAISGMPDICFPRIVRHTSLEISGVIHPVCKPCVSNNFVSNSHVILTGPNRGGKSTFCKSLGLAVVTAQSWGFAWAQRMTWSPFTSIRTALEPYGKLGLYSTFEAEIDFAKSVLETSGHPSFVMMDEIFHSTNATDGVAASSVFLSKLYAKPHTISIISTHYRQLAEQFSRTASPLYMVAEDAEHGKLVYSYKVAHGISDKSSVMEILYERGLLDPVAVNTAI